MQWSFSSAEGHADLKSEMSALDRHFSLCKMKVKSFNIQELLHCKSKSKRHGTKAHTPFLVESFPKTPRT
jgi:hypothetical protein